MRRSVLIAGVILVAVLGAIVFALTRDDAPEVAGPGPADESPAADTSLSFSYVELEGVEPQTFSLTCNPTGGDHPRPDVACAALQDIDLDVFEPVPLDAVCTMIYGGPETATIKGTVAGAPVDGSFKRVSGCEIARWDAIKDLLPENPMDEPGPE